MLLRTKGRGQYGTDKNQWLLFKENDEFAQPTAKGDVLQDKSLSVLSGRSMEEIATQKDAVWQSKPKADKVQPDPSPSSSSKTGPRRGQAAPAQPHSLVRFPQDRDLLVRMQKYDAKKQTFAGVRLTSPDKVLYPEDGITKLELAAYYQMVAKWMLPHLAGRPVVLVRCPEGRHEECFYQKHPAAGTPETLRRIPVRREKKTETFVVVDNVEALVSTTQILCLGDSCLGIERRQHGVPRSPRV